MCTDSTAGTLGCAQFQPFCINPACRHGNASSRNTRSIGRNGNLGAPRWLGPTHHPR